MQKNLSLELLTSWDNDVKSLFHTIQQITKAFYMILFGVFLLSISFNIINNIYLFSLITSVFIFISGLIIFTDIPFFRFDLMKKNSHKFNLNIFLFSLYNPKNINFQYDYISKYIKKIKTEEILLINFPIDNLQRFKILIHLLNNYEKLNINQKKSIYNNNNFKKVFQENNDLINKKLNKKSILKNKNIQKYIHQEIVSNTLSLF